MRYDKTIRIFDPHGGWGMHSWYYQSEHSILTHNKDTGLCNRLYQWEVASHINEMNDNQYQIIIIDSEWPETDLIDLPNTTPYAYTHRVNQFHHIYETQKTFLKHTINTQSEIFEKIPTLTENELNYMFTKNNYKLNVDHIVCDFGYKNIEDFKPKNYENFYQGHPIYNDIKRPTQKIKLKHQFIDEEIRTRCEPLVGIHIRRFNGVTLTDEQLQTFPVDIQKKYKKIEHNKDAVYNAISFYEDKYYFNIIDEILKINPNQRFFISHDLSDDFLSHYKKRYGDKILTKKDFVVKIRLFLEECNFNINKLDNYGDVINNIIDLFCLSYTSFLVQVPKSSWSEFAKNYIPKPVVNVDEDINKIKKVYNSFLLEKNNQNSFVSNVNEMDKKVKSLV